ncbi:MAG: archease [Conexivisphaerales archaeon]
MTEKKYRMLKHTSDAYLEAFGTTLPEVFSHASKGMMAIITDIRKVREETTIPVTSLTGYDINSLLYNWLEYILLSFEVDKLLLPYSNIEILESKGQLAINGTAIGERFDPLRHVIKRQIKGVTYHGMEISSFRQGYRIRVLFDL